MSVVITRDDAKKAGLKRYFTGLPCKHGHIADRLISNYGCMACAPAKFKAYYHANIDAQRRRSAANNCTDKARRRKREKRRAAGEVYRAQRRAQYAADPQRYRAHAAGYRERNPEKARAINRKWQHNNQHIRTAMQRHRDARQLHATPSWADPEAIKLIYLEAATRTKATGIKHEVDHFYPLQGRLVCGLHVADNLRVVPATVNRRKNNRMPEESE